MRCVRFIRTVLSTRSGTTRRAPGSATAACESTTRYCRPRSPNAWSPPPPTARNARSRSHQTTSPWWSNCTDPVRHADEGQHPRLPCAQQSRAPRASPPMRRDPYVADAVPLPMTRDICTGSGRTTHITTVNPDVAIAVPMPVSRLPIVAAAWRRQRLVTRRWHGPIRNRRLRNGAAYAERRQNNDHASYNRSLHQANSPTTTVAVINPLRGNARFRTVTTPARLPRSDVRVAVRLRRGTRMRHRAEMSRTHQLRVFPDRASIVVGLARLPGGAPCGELGI